MSLRKLIRLVRPHERRRLGRWLVWCLLIAGAINVPFAVTRVEKANAGAPAGSTLTTSPGDALLPPRHRRGRFESARRRGSSSGERGFLERREVRRFVQPKLLAQVRQVGENRDNTSVIRAKKLAQHETREELAELKVVAAESMGVAWQRPVADSQCDRCHLPW
ncbi:hypothetical protein JYU07_00575 [Roseiflexus sp. AH-315-K22]|nr:hypothetical protein [Roseiflexus sp. AH-315-K22]